MVPVPQLQWLVLALVVAGATLATVRQVQPPQTVLLVGQVALEMLVVVVLGVPQAAVQAAQAAPIRQVAVVVRVQAPLAEAAMAAFLVAVAAVQPQRVVQAPTVGVLAVQAKSLSLTPLLAASPTGGLTTLPVLATANLVKPRT